ncbi:MAG: hypothetical protein HYY16_07895 [Planctomycetes bacterium]|nr:hypothetical protein [Planctomycetota bacterium]
MATRIKSSRALPIDRKAALVTEESFFERLGANMNTTTGIYNPLDNRTYDATARNRVMKVIDERSSEVKALIKKHAERDLMKTYEEIPKNGVVLYEILHKDLLGPRSTKVVVVGAGFSPTLDLIRNGSSNRRVAAEELARVKDLVVQNPNVFYYVGAFSTTSWEEGCRNILVGGNFLMALCDLYDEAWRTYFPPDGRWRGAARVFDLTTEEEKIEAVRRFARKHTFEILMDELSEDFVFDQLGYAIPIIREAFEQLAAEDRFLRFDTGTRPYRLVRTYG